MPFTFSHPALVLPFKYLPKHWFSFTGLIIGSMVPDFEYFIRMRIYSIYSHTLPGLLWFDLPLGLLLSFLFHNVVKTKLIDNLPRLIKARFQPLKQFTWNKYFIGNWFIVAISILVGATTHLFWDNFTHNNGFFVQHIPWLSNETKILGTQIHNSNIVQHLSTLIGVLCILYFIWKLPTEEKIQPPFQLKYWLLVTLLIISILTIRFMTGMNIREYGNVIVTTISAGLIAISVIPTLLRSKN